MKTVLITGGAGFIAKNLIKRLCEDGSVSKIFAVDNFISSDIKDFSLFLLKLNSKKLYFKEVDITTQEFLRYIEDLKFNFDEIYHLASIATPIGYKKNKLATLDVGYIGTRNILEIARKRNSKILFSSTSEVYGDPNCAIQNENYYGNVNVFGERSCYDESKRVAESLCYSYIKDYNLNVKICRIFNTYGPYMKLDDGRIVTEAIKHMLNGTSLTIYGNGTQTRSFCYVDDMVDMVIKLMSSSCNTPVNLGNDEEIKIIDVVKITEEEGGMKIKYHFKDMTENDPIQRKPCLIKNKKILGEKEYTSFKKGVRKTIEFFQKRYC